MADPTAEMRNMLRTLEAKTCTRLSARLLHAALELARTHRWIAEWLFPNASQTPAHPPLNPEAFDNGLAVHKSHELNAPDYEMMQSPVVQRALPEKKLIMRKELDLLVVPVVHWGRCTAGYSFCNGHKYTQMTGHQPVTHSSGDLLMSRFVYDQVSRQFLLITQLPSEQIVGILQVIFHCDGSVERNFLTVPFLHYSADCLPSVIISSQCNLETRDLNTVPMQYQYEDKPDPPPPQQQQQPAFHAPTPQPNAAPLHMPELNQTMDDLLDELTNLERPFSPTDNFPLDLGAGDPAFDPFSMQSAAEPSPPPPPAHWSFRADGSTDDGIGVPRKPGGSPSSAGAFDMSEMTRALAKLERKLTGSFFCLRAKHDVLDPATGELLNRQTGQQISQVRTLTKHESANLRHLAAQTYYATTLSSRMDARLVAPTITAAAQQLVLPMISPAMSGVSGSTTSGGAVLSGVSSTMSGSTSSTSAALPAPPSAPASRVVGSAPQPIAMLAPRPLDRRAAPANGTVVDATYGVTDKAELKKIRNRLSAAKSNQRRRQQLEAQRRELETLQQRVTELRRRKQAAAEQNTMLRSLVYGNAL